MTSVTFELRLAGDAEEQTLTETEIRDAGAALGEVDFENVDGSLVIDTGTGRLALEDELSSAVVNLCFNGVEHVLSHPADPYLYRFAYATSHVVVVPLADSVRIFGEETTVVEGAQADLLPQLYRCGLRYIAFLASSEDEQARYIAVTLQDRADAAERALTEHGLSTVG